MKFTKLDTDLSHVSKLPDSPTLEGGYTPEMLKSTFDRGANDIKNYVNDVLIPSLENEGADKIGVAFIQDLEGESVQEMLENMMVKIREATTGTIPDGSILPEKFTAPIALFMTEGSPRAQFFTEPGTHTFIPTRTGYHKISVQGAGGGGSWAYIGYGGGSGAFTKLWTRLEKGHEYTLVIGEGGKGLVVADDQKQVLSYASEGGYSAFYDAETEMAYAEGGKIDYHNDGPATSRGGQLCINGEFPFEVYYNSSVQRLEGAPSQFGVRTVKADTPAQIGAGGYGAYRYSNSNQFAFGGTDGGNGAILIEWME